jgi:dienelactone hydrolase
MLPVDVWFPRVPADLDERTYELFPGIGFTAAASIEGTPLPQELPVVVWSHGRTGTRTSYVMLCEALAARGYAVIAPDHPGDTLADWLSGTAADDATNETQRLGDVSCILKSLRSEQLVQGLTIDINKVVVVGHSYGGWTAIAAAASADSVHLRGAAALQPFSRTIPRDALRSIDLPVLLVAGTADPTTPPIHDAHRAIEEMGGDSVHLIEIAAAGHQACSDVGLYIELAEQIDTLPQVVRDLVGSMAGDVTGTAGDPWRPTVSLHARIVGSWLSNVLGETDSADSLQQFSVPGVTVRSRP